MPTLSHRKSFLQQGSDLRFPGDFYMGKIQQFDCQECLESFSQWLAWQRWLEGERGFGTSLLMLPSTPPLLCHSSPP